MSHIRRIADYLRLIKKSLSRFAAVGAIGFIINFGVLTLLYKILSLKLLPAQLIAAELAILSNFYLHNGWTYKDAIKDSFIKRFIEFHVSSWVGAGLTTLTLVVLVHQEVQYTVALIIGALVALIWNFFLTRFIIWKPKQSAYEEL